MTTSALPAAGTLPVRRYNPIFVALHWVIAIFVFIAPLLASESEAPGPGGIPVIGLHMIFGLTVLGLMLIRLLLRFGLRRPAWATAGNSLFDVVGRLTHFGLYLFTFSVTITGLIVAMQSNRLAVLTGGAQQFRPGISQPGQVAPGLQPGGEGGEGSEGGFQGGVRTIGRFIFRAFHELSWKLLLALIILHVGAALYHQFILHDNLLGRMWFGSRT